jgi:hypothetical protein
MRHILILLLLVGSPLCFGQVDRDKEPVAPPVNTAAAGRSYHDQLALARTDGKVFICDSKTARAYRKDQNCRGLNRCTHEGVEVTKKEAEEDYGRVQCRVCY